MTQPARLPPDPGSEHDWVSGVLSATRSRRAIGRRCAGSGRSERPPHDRSARASAADLGAELDYENQGHQGEAEPRPLQAVVRARETRPGGIGGSQRDGTDPEDHAGGSAQRKPPISRRKRSGIRKNRRRYLWPTPAVPRLRGLRCGRGTLEAHEQPVSNCELVCGASLGGSTASLPDCGHPNEHEYALVVDVEEALRLELNRSAPGSSVDEAPNSVSAPEHRSVRYTAVRSNSTSGPMRSANMVSGWGPA